MIKVVCGVTCRHCVEKCDVASGTAATTLCGKRPIWRENYILWERVCPIWRDNYIFWERGSVQFGKITTFCERVSNLTDNYTVCGRVSNMERQLHFVRECPIWQITTLCVEGCPIWRDSILWERERVRFGEITTLCVEGCTIWRDNTFRDSGCPVWQITTVHFTVFCAATLTTAQWTSRVAISRWLWTTGHWSLLFPIFQICASGKVGTLLKSVAYCQTPASTLIATHHHSYQFHHFGVWIQSGSLIAVFLILITRVHLWKHTYLMSSSLWNRKSFASRQ